MNITVILSRSTAAAMPGGATAVVRFLASECGVGAPLWLLRCYPTNHVGRLQHGSATENRWLFRDLGPRALRHAHEPVNRANARKKNWDTPTIRVRRGKRAPPRCDPGTEASPNSIRRIASSSATAATRRIGDKQSSSVPGLQTCDCP